MGATFQDFKDKKVFLSVKRTLKLGSEETQQDYGALFEIPHKIGDDDFQLSGWLSKDILVVAKFDPTPGKAKPKEGKGDGEASDLPALRVFALHDGTEPIEFATGWKHQAKDANKGDYLAGHTLHLSGKDRGKAKDRLAFFFPKKSASSEEPAPAPAAAQAPKKADSKPKK